MLRGLHPAQAVGGGGGGKVLGAHPAGVAGLVEGREDVGEIDLSGARLVTARRVGELDVGDAGQMGFERGISPPCIIWRW